jgi:hypothetical protein
MLPTCGPNFANVAHTIWKVEWASSALYWVGYQALTVFLCPTQIFKHSQSPISLCFIQAAGNVVGLTSVRANGRLSILTGYCLMVYGNHSAHNLFLCCRTTGRTAQGDTGWTSVQQCAWSGGSTVQSICARGSLSVSCTTVTTDTNAWDYKIC